MMDCHSPSPLSNEDRRFQTSFYTFADSAKYVRQPDIFELFSDSVGDLHSMLPHAISRYTTRTDYCQLEHNQPSAYTTLDLPIQPHSFFGDS